MVNQLEGYLEVYPPSDSTSIYIGRGVGRSINSTFDQYNLMLVFPAGNELKDARRNVILGNYAFSRGSAGTDNSFIGYLSALNLETGDRNNFLGRSSGINLDSGNDNLFRGNFSGAAIRNGSSNICIGNNAGPPSGSNQSSRL